MATRVMVGTVKDKRKSVAAAVLYDSVTMTTFGPVLTVESAGRRLRRLRGEADVG
jgi:hypothetical protein